ncbi:uncharacterized protein LOC125278459 isoform X1 [Megalobrama amblycephala]|uniref:uncharacterized protein LOC125278459 isoform X1 n=2 Tax=Megalobrama amblycephala TaxID=75352 RepID=UPI00201408C9|nr:uncharacterized protein LOC125278459 isoform X1 [Megalobrama amblycephala]
MPRTWVRKTDHGVDASLLKRAAEQVRKGKSVRAVAKSHGICHVTLNRYWQKYKELKDQGSRDLPRVGYYSPHQVFTREQEETLSQYISQAADIYYGLTPREVRKFAYQLAVEFNIQHPQTWDEKKMAGPDWFSSFMKRNPRLSVRSPQATSLSRATSFNRANVELFFSQLGEVIDKNGFDGSDIWNVDETGVTTVQAPSRVVARWGMKQVGAMTSGERGTLVSVAYAVQALGNTIPPFFVFPCRNFKDHFVQSGPLGSAGRANSSGWMQEEDFLSFLVHFVKHTKVSPERKVLLLLDNHSSHISVRAVDFCKGHGIVLLTFPPHCSHKLQPLDRSVFGPFKRMVNSASDDWMRGNPDKTMSIYDIPGIVRIALPTAATQKNIQAGFQCTGIWPYNCKIFQDCDFALSQVTDRPDPSGALQQNSSPSHLPPGSSPPYLPPGSSPAHLLPGSSPDHLSPGSSLSHLPLGSSLSHLPPISSPPYLPPGSSPAHLPPGSSLSHLPPGSSLSHLPLGSSLSHLPPISSPPYLPPGSSPAHLPPDSSLSHLPTGSSLPAARLLSSSPATRLLSSSPATRLLSSSPAARLLSISPADWLLLTCRPAPLQLTCRPAPPYLTCQPAPPYLPLGSSPAHLPPGSSPAHLPPGSSPPYLPPGSSPAHLPPGSSPAHLPPGSSPAHLPPGSSLSHLPTGSSLPAARLLSSSPATRLLSSSPATRLLSSSPATRLLSSSPATRLLSSLPAARLLSSLPAARLLSSSPVARLLC